MSVVAMAMMSAMEAVFYIIIGVLAFCSYFSVTFAYVLVFFLFFQYAVIIWSIPGLFNWSNILYSIVLRKVLTFFFVTIISFAIIYRFYGVIDSMSENIIKDFFNSLYFSITTWSTLGYGDLKPLPNMRLFTSFEAILGILSFPLIFSIIWRYCDISTFETPLHDKEFDGDDRSLKLDDRGFWQQYDKDGNILELKTDYDLRPCCKCGSDKLKVERYFLIQGQWTPRTFFMVHCKCGNNVCDKITSMLAYRGWNKENQ